MKRNKFSLSHSQLLSCDMGELIPISWFEALPGDSIQQSTSLLLRTTPLNTPVMHPVSVRIHHWFVPNRLIWDDWQDFITGGEDGLNASSIPYINMSPAAGSLADYLGLPLGVNINPSALPFRAYSLIFNEFYRDQDLVTKLTISKASSTDTTTNTTLQNVAWEKDRYTSSRPWTQKGAAVTLPLGTTAPVVSSGAHPVQVRENGVATDRNLQSSAIGTNSMITSTNWTGGASDILWGTTTGLQADLSSATAVSINTLRTALALQRFEEWRAKFGSRYTEYLRALGVRSSDARLQRPEYLGGGKQTIQFSEVLSNTPTSSSNPVGVGQMAGHGISAMRSNRYRRFFEEHGIVMTLLSVRPKTVYATGYEKAWTRGSKFEYWQPQYEHIGQQTVLNQEVDATHGTLTGTFGYQDRYDEYRRQESKVTGLFRPGQVYDVWTLTRAFSGLPALNAAFVTCTPSTRIYQSASTDTLLVMANHSIQARRMLSPKATNITF